MFEEGPAVAFQVYPHVYAHTYKQQKCTSLSSVGTKEKQGVSGEGLLPGSSCLFTLSSHCGRRRWEGKGVALPTFTTLDF